MNETTAIQTGLRLAQLPSPGGDRASQLLDAYQRAVHLRQKLMQAGEIDREIATAVAARAALDRGTCERAERAQHEADCG